MYIMEENNPRLIIAGCTTQAVTRRNRSGVSKGNPQFLGANRSFLGQVPQFLRAKWWLSDNVSKVCKLNLAKSVILRILLINHWSIRLQIHVVSHLVIQLIRLELLLFHNLVTTMASHANIGKCSIILYIMAHIFTFC